MRFLIAALLCGSSLFAGRSLVVTGTQQFGNTSVAAQPANGACKAEFQVKVENLASNVRGFADACGIDITIATNSTVQIYSGRTTGWGCCHIFSYSGYADGIIIMRYQMIPSGAGGMLMWEAFDRYGTRHEYHTQAYTGTTGSNTNGVILGAGGSGSSVSWGFFRLSTSTVPAGSRVPTFADTADLLNWRFDGGNNTGSLNDASPNGYHASGVTPASSCGSAPCYTATVGQDLIHAVVKTSPAPTWGDRRTLRVGFANQLDASASFSMADGSADVSCDWSVVGTTPAAMSLNLSDSSDNCSPTASPSARGDYETQVTLTDAGMNTSQTTVHLGAAVMNANGVIQLANAALETIFGPMIGLGWNPWGLADERHVYAHTSRRAVYNTARPFSPSHTNGNPEWDTARPGSVVYQWNGKGTLGAPATTLSTGINATDLTIVVADASVLDLSSLPTRITIETLEGGIYKVEEIAICSRTGNTLTVCYDGRGIGSGGSYAGFVSARSWTSGVTVGQSLIKGTDTDFEGGAEKLCEAGPGPMGPIKYSTGTVSVTAGSPTISGSGTSWRGMSEVVYSLSVTGASWSGGTATLTIPGQFFAVGNWMTVSGVSPSGYNGTYQITAIDGTSVSYALVSNPGSFSSAGTAYWTAPYAMRIEGTHSGTPFVFAAYLSSVAGDGSIRMNRNFPSDADTASGLTYQIIRPFFRLPVTSFTRPTYGGSAWIPWGGTSCVSDTQAFFSALGVQGADVTDMNGDAFSGESYTYIDSDSSTINQSSTGGMDFYSEELAWYSLGFRSGLAEPFDTARLMGNHWIRNPFLRGGIGNAPVISPLFIGGGIVGAITCLAVDPDCGLSWADVRGFINQGKYWATNGTCTTWDTRDGGWLGNALAWGAKFDPDTSMGGYREQWRAALTDWETLENTCKGDDNSWANGFYTNFNDTPAVTLTNGSAAATGTGFTAGMCWGRANGTFTISGNTLTANTGTFLSTAAYKNIVLNDASGNRMFTQITYVNGTTATLHSVWAGDSTGTWLQLEGQGGELVGMTVWGQNSSSPSLAKNYECTYNSSTSLTLERPWEFTSSSTAGPYYKYTANLAGKGQQPYMVAIKQLGFGVAATLDAELGTNFATLRDAAATWVANTGYDTEIKGMRYGTIFQSCEPPLTAASAQAWKQPGCSYGTDTASQIAARMLNGESARAFVHNTTNRLARGDAAYAALWCSTQYNDATLYPEIPACDSAAPGDNMGASNLLDSFFDGGKWSGFFFGAGMAHQWPAARLEEEAPTPEPTHTTGGGRTIGGGSKF